MPTSLTATLLITFTATTAALAEAGIRTQIKIVDQSAERLRISYETVGATSIDTQQDQLSSLIGSCIIGIPVESTPQLEVVEARVAARSSTSAAEREATGLRLEGPAFLGETGFVRDQRVVKLAFSPRHTDAELLIYDRVVADVHFEAVQPNPQPSRSVRRDHWGELLYQQVVINYEQAMRWRMPRPVRRPSAKVAQQLVGDRLKITVRQTGMYKISGRDLIEAGLQLEGIEPSLMRMLYGGGQILNPNLLSRRITTSEIAIAVEAGGDGRFDVEDYLLFYGEAPERWEYDRSSRAYEWRPNPYTRDNVYWLDPHGPAAGRRAEVVAEMAAQEGPLRSDRYRERIHVEDDRFILTQTLGISSGYDWYWEEFRGNATDFVTTLSDVVSEGPVDIRIGLWGWTVGQHSFQVRWNGGTAGTVQASGAAPQTLKLSTRLRIREGLNELRLAHLDANPTRLDWYELEYTRRMLALEGELVFDWTGATRYPFDGGDAEAGDDGDRAAEFHLSGFDGRPRIFDISNRERIEEIARLEYDESEGKVVFQGRFDGVGAPPWYAVLDPARGRRPAGIEMDSPSNLRSPDNGADYVIITHADFGAASDRLAAWRGQDDRFGAPMKTTVVDVADIYDEFSGGLLDPTAIRTFVNYAVDNWDPPPFYILLMGDGTYDYKNNLGTSHPNWMPAFQDGESTYDEWYVRVDGRDPLPDLAIGRLPVQTPSEADEVVDKLIDYDRNPEVGPWQARALLVSDDVTNPSFPGEKELFFVHDSERLASLLVPDQVDVVKLYIGRFPHEGRTKPLAREAFLRRFNEGSLILAYVGHGNPETLAHEQMFVLSRDIGNIDNGRRLPFMYMAASQVGVFDDPGRESIPEALLVRRNGLIGIISATRVGFHASNMILAHEFYRQMYHRSSSAHVPVGLALTAAKQIVAVSDEDRINVQRYSLLGDPAMRLARPRYTVELDVPDSMSALEEASFEGRVLDPQGRFDAQFHGSAWVQAFDSKVPATIEGQQYLRTGAPIFRGQVPVASGRFEAVFRVPRDINYRSGNARISAYVWSDDRPAAFGAADAIRLTETAREITPDDEGPRIAIGFKGQTGFRSGDFVSSHPVMETVIEDESGINITGETGHNIIVTLDGKVSRVTDSFDSRNGDYRTGVLEYELPELQPGEHRIGLKAWDNFNNSTTVEAELQVSEPGDGILTDLLFHPNPMRDRGHFTYTLSSQAEMVRIRVFSLAGRLVDELDGDGGPGFNQVAWIPEETLANGSYPFHILVKLQSGAEYEASSIIQVIR